MEDIWETGGEPRAGGSTIMSPPAIDVYARVRYGPHKLHRKRLFVAVAFCAACAFFAVLPEETAPTFFGKKLDVGLFRLLAILGLLLGIGWSAYDLYRWLRPGTALVELLPEGIIFRGGAENFIVPWNEIHGVDTIDIETSHRGHRIVFENVTVVLVSEFFYDRVIHVDNFILRGPGWDNLFIPKGDKVQIALHHEILPVTTEELRRQVEARWRAFGKSGAAVPARSTYSVAGTEDV